jgi:hypothetical protein
MNSLGDAIGLEKEELFFSRSAKGRAIVAGAERLILGHGNKPEKLAEQAILGAGLHGNMFGQ